jgi:hypothetical protein
MTMTIGGAPGTQYSGDDLVKGKCPRVGTVLKTNDADGTKEYVLCLVAASQNLIDGHLVTIAPATFTVTIAAAGNPAAAAANVLGVARTSVTASASAYIWVQRYGVGSVQASASTLPNIRLSMAAAAGLVDDAVTSVSGGIVGIVLTATTAASGITACFLNYPAFEAPSPILV